MAKPIVSSALAFPVLVSKINVFTCFAEEAAITIVNVMMEVDPGDDGGKEDKFKPDDDSDPVVAEVPVYLSKSLNCYLYQYPVRPASMTYDNTQVIRARFRPNHKQVHLEVKLNTKSENYDRSKGEQIAVNTDGCSPAPGATTFFQSQLMDKQVLAGGTALTRAEAGPDTGGRYAVARLEAGGELHLTQLQAVLQLRPSLGYMDKSDRTARAEGRAKDDPDDLEDEDKPPQAVTVKFSRVS